MNISSDQVFRFNNAPTTVPVSALNFDHEEKVENCVAFTPPPFRESRQALQCNTQMPNAAVAFRRQSRRSLKNGVQADKAPPTVVKRADPPSPSTAKAPFGKVPVNSTNTGKSMLQMIPSSENEDKDSDDEQIPVSALAVKSANVPFDAFGGNTGNASESFFPTSSAFPDFPAFPAFPDEGNISKSSKTAEEELGLSYTTTETYTCTEANNAITKLEIVGATSLTFTNAAAALAGNNSNSISNSGSSVAGSPLSVSVLVDVHDPSLNVKQLVASRAVKTLAAIKTGVAQQQFTTEIPSAEVLKAEEATHALTVFKYSVLDTVKPSLLKARSKLVINEATKQVNFLCQCMVNSAFPAELKDITIDVSFAGVHAAVPVKTVTSPSAVPVGGAGGCVYNAEKHVLKVRIADVAPAHPTAAAASAVGAAGLRKITLETAVDLQSTDALCDADKIAALKTKFATLVVPIIVRCEYGSTITSVQINISQAPSADSFFDFSSSTTLSQAKNKGVLVGKDIVVKKLSKVECRFI
jgi:hypothetical protein